jgi:hypothetical protein
LKLDFLSFFVVLFSGKKTMNITPNTLVPRLGMGQSMPGGSAPSFTGSVLSIPNGHGPNSGSFGGIPVKTTTAATNQSTLDHARKPINYTYLIDLDQNNLIALRHKQRHPDNLGGVRNKSHEDDESTAVTNGELNKNDICVMKRISSSVTGIAYSVKNISREARQRYGTQRHHGRLTDEWDLHGLLQVGNVYKKNFGRFSAYSLEFSTAQYAVPTNVWKACELQPWHKFTKHTAIEGDYVGFVLIRLRYEKTANYMASIAQPSKKKKQRIDPNDNNNNNPDHKDPLTHPDYASWPAYKRYNLKEYEEELNHEEHFWQLVPYISSLASGPYQDFLENQHFTGRVFPMGQVWETYGTKIKPDSAEAHHALYYLFPWLEKSDAPWRERMLEHRSAIKSNLTLNFKLNSHRLYVL